MRCHPGTTISAAVAAAVNAGTYLGLSMHGAGSTLAMLHLTTMALMAILIVRIRLHHLLPFTQHGEGAAELRNGQDAWVVRDSVVQTLTPGSAAAFDSAMLRAFSVVWLFFGLVIALAGHTVEAPIRDYRSALRQASA